MKKVGENINFFQSQGLSYLSLTGRLSKADQIIKIQEFIRPKFVKAIIATCNIQGKKVPKELLENDSPSGIIWGYYDHKRGLVARTYYPKLGLSMNMVVEKAAGRSRYRIKTSADEKTLTKGDIVLVEDLIAGTESEEPNE